MKRREAMLCVRAIAELILKAAERRPEKMKGDVVLTATEAAEISARALDVTHYLIGAPDVRA